MYCIAERENTSVDILWTLGNKLVLKNEGMLWIVCEAEAWVRGVDGKKQG